MSVKVPIAKSKVPKQRGRPLKYRWCSELLETTAIFAWALLLGNYWWTGKVVLLLHPDYVWLTVGAALVLLGLGGCRGWQLLRYWRQSRFAPLLPPSQHIALLPARWSSSLLLATALLGLMVTPRAFASHTALQRGVTDSLGLMDSLVSEKLQPQAFWSRTSPQERSLIDWVRTLSVYPEPDAYGGQKVNVTGFVIHPPDLPSDYLLLARFVITCCAADAYPVALPVQLIAPPQAYAADSWLQVEGEMATAVLNGDRRLVIRATQLTPVPEPQNPYAYNDAQ